MQQSTPACGGPTAGSQMELKDPGGLDMINEIVPEDCKRVKRAHRTLFLKISGRDFGNQASTTDFGVMDVGNQVTLRDLGAINVFQQTSLKDPGAKDACIQTAHSGGGVDAGQQTTFRLFGTVVDAGNQVTLRRWGDVNIGQQTNLEYHRAVDVGSQTASTECRGVDAEQQVALAILGTMNDAGHQIALRNWGNVDVRQQTVSTGYADGEQIPLFQSLILERGSPMISKGIKLADKRRSQANPERLDAGKNSLKGLSLALPRSSGAVVNVDQQPQSVISYMNAREESSDSKDSNAKLLDHQRALLGPTLTSSASYLTTFEGSAPVGIDHQVTLDSSMANDRYSQTDSKDAIAETGRRTDRRHSRAINSDQQKDLEVNNAISQRTTTGGTVETKSDRQFHVNGWDDAGVDFGCQVACGQCGFVVNSNQQSVSPYSSPTDNCDRSSLEIDKAGEAWPFFQCGICGASPGSSTVVIPTAMVQLLQDPTSDVGLQTTWVDFCASDSELQTTRTDIGVIWNVNQMTPPTVYLPASDLDGGSRREGFLSQERQHDCWRHVSASVRQHQAGSKPCQLVDQDVEEDPAENFATAFHEGLQELYRWEKRFSIPNSGGCQVCKREYIAKKWLEYQEEEGKAPNDLHPQARRKDVPLSHFQARSPRIEHLCRGEVCVQALPRDFGFVEAEQQTGSNSTRLQEAHARWLPPDGKPTVSVSCAEPPSVDGEACEGVYTGLPSQGTYEDESMEERRHSSHNAGVAEQNFYIQKQALNSNSKELGEEDHKNGLPRFQTLEGDLVGPGDCTGREADSTTVALEEEAFNLCSLWALTKLRSRIKSYAPGPQPGQRRPRSRLFLDCRGLGLASSMANSQSVFCSACTAEAGVQKDDSLCPGESRKVDRANLSDVLLHVCSLWVFVILKVCAEESKLGKGLGKPQLGHTEKRPRLPLLAAQGNSKFKALRRAANPAVVSASSAAAVDETTRRFILKREHRPPRLRHLRYSGVEPVTFKSSTPFFIQSSGECSLVRRRPDSQLPAPGPAGGIQGLNCYKITCGVQSRRVVHFLKNGVNRLGSNADAHIRIKGLSEDHTEIIYMPPHCCIQKKGYVVARVVAPEAMAFLNGQPMLEHKELSTGDVLVLRDLRHRSSVCTLHFFDLVKFASA